MAEDGADNASRAIERVTIAEAAALLGCHPNSVRNRVKAGMYRAEKFHTENGPTWMIERDSLTANAPTKAAQQAVSVVPAAQQEALQELAKAIVREAGLATDSEEAGRRENDKARAEVWRTLAFLDTALLAGIAATVAFLGLEKIARESIGLLVVSVATNLAGLTFAILTLMIATMAIGAEAYQDGAYVARLRWWREWVGAGAYAWFGVSLLTFLVFVGNNLNALRP